MKNNFIKKAFIVAILGVFLTIPSLTLGAADNANVTAAKNKAIESLKTRENREIDRRLASLGKLLTKINSLKKLTSEQKSSYTSEIQKNVSDLTALKAKISSETDLDALKNDVKLITESYRIYAVFLPKINILSASDVASQLSSKIAVLSDKLSIKIAAAESNGKDVSELKTLLADMKSKINSANTNIRSAQDAATSVDPSGYPGNKSTLQNARKSLASARQDLMAAKQDASKIIKGLKALEENSEASSSTGINSSN